MAASSEGERAPHAQPSLVGHPGVAYAGTMTGTRPSVSRARRRRRPAPAAAISVQIIRLIPWLVIGVGVALRLIRFLHNRALWGDEAALALNLIHRSPRELFEPLDFDQASPVLSARAERRHDAVRRFCNSRCERCRCSPDWHHCRSSGSLQSVCLRPSAPSSV